MLLLPNDLKTLEDDNLRRYREIVGSDIRSRLPVHSTLGQHQLMLVQARRRTPLIRLLMQPLMLSKASVVADSQPRYRKSETGGTSEERSVAALEDAAAKLKWSS
jgi:hypothetical protein